MNKFKDITTKLYRILYLAEDNNSYIGVVTDGQSKQMGTWCSVTLEPWANNIHLGSLIKRDPEIVATTRHAIMRHWVTKSLKHENKYEGAIGYIRVKYFDDNTFKVEVENDPKTLSK